ncbi:MAG TPA: nitroreductase family protein [Acidobacteriota bacterium]|nr:nitroreductase family protein [Acidobacteriota bacterium]
MIKELITKTRSYRRFDENRRITREELLDLVDCARLSASAGNRQPLKYILSWQAETNEKIFPHLRWAAYLKDWPGPGVGERPTAYIVILGDTTVHPGFECDHGIAAQSIMLAATEKGLGGCMIASINREALRRELGIAPTLEILLVLALGRPTETVVIDPLPPSGDIRYWRDNEQRHHVPKRSLDELVLK